ncbi:hypothetical protein [Chitinilyticum piscinae]|uniref:Uncharacterized protein n=1 Tax=Chitinilyticum piscinae TaxID=2866724 RepID=A0A8J7FIE9_9NEIS|nr:hypothetical protein [Chitinilyticum piscinae]MBE9609880.1 hypothetical protein [Chitinilyticum piscinae]
MPRQGLLALCLLAASVQADEVVTLSPQHRSAQELASALQRTFPEAAFTPFYQQLLVRAPDAATLARIREVLATLDQAARNLTLTVEQRQVDDLDAWEAAVRGKVLIGSEGSSAVLALRLAQLHEATRLVNRSVVTTQDGGQAWIQLGQSRYYPVWSWWPGSALPVRGGQWVSTGSGFYARPQQQGAQIRVLLSPQAGRFRPDGSISSAGSEAEVLVSPGQWQLIGESRQEGSTSSSGMTSGNRTQLRSYQVWLKVD